MGHFGQVPYAPPGAKAGRTLLNTQVHRENIHECSVGWSECIRGTTRGGCALPRRGPIFDLARPRRRLIEFYVRFLPIIISRYVVACISRPRKGWPQTLCTTVQKQAARPSCWSPRSVGICAGVRDTVAVECSQSAPSLQ